MSDTLHTIIKSDVYAGLASLKDNSIDVAVTSPPYWGQRDYGFEGQIGNEEKYEDYINKLVTIFDLLKAKISEKGVFFLNVGDKYGSKYGRTPLLMIPFQLAYMMVQNGWYLNDILIWFKPNHMPSSVKNRFTNSYEPVFVFSKSKINIYQEGQNKLFSNPKVLKVTLQATPYKHVAVYPEKLVEKLFEKVQINDKTTFLDPFAGSGTTLKVAKRLYPNNHTFMIECNSDYVEIIKERCNLNGNYAVRDEIFTEYEVIKQNFNDNQNFDWIESYILNNKSKGLLKIFNKKEEYYHFINSVFKEHNNTKSNYKSVFFVGSRDYNIDLFNFTSKLNTKGWIVRNLIVVEEEDGWFPIFLIVHD
ncbi:MAG: site-specific DNA-methyltransferase, partial [Ignavibacteria bacterium]|nr:site-specific DNA-methyltransferase [Ignavibacteria bacterium]